MKCEQVVENAHDLLLDLLESDVRREMEDHARSCGSCGQALEKARTALSVLHEWQPTVPKSRTTRRAVRPVHPWKSAIAAAAALVGIAVLIVLFSGRRTPTAPDLSVQRNDAPAISVEPK